MKTTSTLAGIQAAGFKSDSTSNHLNMKNDLGVTLQEFLVAIGFTVKSEIENKKEWSSYSKDGIDFKINHRVENALYATVDFIN